MSKERLEEIRQKYYTDVYDCKLGRFDIQWLIEQAERFERMKEEFAQDIDFKRKEVIELTERVRELLKAHELKDIENQGLVQQLKTLQSDFEEVKRVGETHRSNELKLEKSAGVGRV